MTIKLVEIKTTAKPKTAVKGTQAYAEVITVMDGAKIKNCVLTNMTQRVPIQMQKYQKM